MTDCTTDRTDQGQIHVTVTISDKRETKKPDRGIVTYTHTVTNQRGDVVLEAQVKRMIKRAPAKA